MRKETTEIQSKCDKSGGGDEQQGQDAWDVRVWFVARSDVESRQWCDHDEGNAATMTKCTGRVKKDDGGHEFVRCRFVEIDFKPRRVGPRDDMFAAMPLPEAKEALFAGRATRDENKVGTK